jgi:hypothetical protein
MQLGETALILDEFSQSNVRLRRISAFRGHQFCIGGPPLSSIISFLRRIQGVPDPLFIVIDPSEDCLLHLPRKHQCLSMPSPIVSEQFLSKNCWG